MATDLYFAKKRLKMTKSSNAYQSFRITAKALNNSSIYVLYGKAIYIWLGLPDFRERQVENVGEKGQISHFSRAFEGNTANSR